MKFIPKFKDKDEVVKMTAYYLKEMCPAFDMDEKNLHTSATWHHCYCRAKASDDGATQCTCVWHLTKECFAGEWLEMKFIDDYYKQINKKSEKYRDKLHRVPPEVLRKSDEL